jgi:hypothetical protein
VQHPGKNLVTRKRAPPGWSPVSWAGSSPPRRMGYAAVAGSCAVSCVGCLGLIIFVAVVLAGVGILLGATAPR